MTTRATYYRRRAALALAIVGTAAAVPMLAAADNRAGTPPGDQRPNGNPTTSTADGYPARIELPAELAQAIGRARADACGSGPGTGYAWAQVDEGGNVTDIATACTAGAAVQVIDPNAPNYCAEDDACWIGSTEDDSAQLPRTR